MNNPNADIQTQKFMESLERRRQFHFTNGNDAHNLSQGAALALTEVLEAVKESVGAPTRPYLVSSASNSAAKKRTVVILLGPTMCGKTTLARLLTGNGASGAILDAGWEPHRKDDLEQYLNCRMVVICSGPDHEDEPSIRGSVFSKLLGDDAEVMFWKLERLPRADILDQLA